MSQTTAQRRHRVSDAVHGPFRRGTALPPDSAEGEGIQAAEGERIQAIVARARDGDRDALGEIYARYADNVFGYVCSILRDEHEAEDVTQHVFLKLMSVLDRYQPREVPFSAWILRVARNAAVDSLRQRRAIPVDDRLEQQEPSHAYNPRRVSYLRDGLASLPTDQRRVLLMRHLIGLTPPEIAEQMGKTESSIHGLHHRGRGALCGSLTGMQEGPSTLRRVSANA